MRYIYLYFPPHFTNILSMNCQSTK